MLFWEPRLRMSLWGKEGSWGQGPPHPLLCVPGCPAPSLPSLLASPGTSPSGTPRARPPPRPPGHSPRPSLPQCSRVEFRLVDRDTGKDDAKTSLSQHSKDHAQGLPIWAEEKGDSGVCPRGCSVSLERRGWVLPQGFLDCTQVPMGGVGRMVGGPGGRGLSPARPGVGQPGVAWEGSQPPLWVLWLSREP